MFVFVLVPLIVLTCVFPGLTLVRRLRLSPLETLCDSVGVSIALAYGWQMASLVCGRPVAMPYVWSAVALLAAVLTWRDARRLLGRRQVRGAVYATAGLGAFGLLAAAMVRHFSGGDWAGDWLEHHLRVGYFLAKVPREYLYANTYLLPARPPLQNAAAALFAAQVGYEFEVVQVTFAMFAATVMPAMLLVARDLVPRARVRWWVMLAMVVTTPCVAQNMTWTWPKLLTVTYVLTGIHFYLAGWRKEDGRRVTLAFGMLAAGCITHFSGAVFAVVIGVHYVAATLARRRWAWREWAASASVTLIVLASWFGYSAAVFGVKATVWSNSTLLREHDGQSLHENIVTLTGKHLLTSLVPAAARGEPGPATVFTWSRLRNAGFAMYQSNLLIMMGLVAGLTAVWLNSVAPVCAMF
jgi:hypothetical protein